MASTPGAAKHGLVVEISVWSASGVKVQVKAIKQLTSETDESLGEQSEGISK